MKYLFILLFLISPQISFAASFDEASLKKNMAEMVQLIESKKYAELLEKYTDPDRIKKVKEQGNFDKMAETWGKSEKSQRLKQALSKAIQIKPNLDKKNQTATFNIPGAHRALVFDFKKDRWIMRN